MLENITAGPGGGCDGPTYTVFTEVFIVQIPVTFLISDSGPQTTHISIR